MAESINPDSGQCYYSIDVEDVKMLCRVLNIGDGRMSKISNAMAERYMGLADKAIDTMLFPHYFLPLRPYRALKVDGVTTITIFPGGLSTIAQRWAAGLMLSSEFQDLEPNANDSATKYVEDSRQDLTVMLLTNTKIPGQIPRTSFSRTMPPGMMPTRFPETR